MDVLILERPLPVRNTLLNAREIDKKRLKNSTRTNMTCRLVAISLLMCLGSCMPREHNEIAEMTDKCFQHRQGIVITFMPTPELSHDGKEEKIK